MLGLTAACSDLVNDGSWQMNEARAEGAGGNNALHLDDDNAPGVVRRHGLPEQAAAIVREALQCGSPNPGTGAGARAGAASG